MWARLVPLFVGSPVWGVGFVRLEGRECLAPHLGTCSALCMHKLMAFVMERLQQEQKPIPTAEELLLFVTPGGAIQ